MSAIERYDARSSMDIADEAWKLAQRLGQTDFVKSNMRGKPEAVLAAILMGDELGIGPMQSLSKIDVIEGRPACSAELMRALITRSGHEIWVEESTNTRCTIAGKRKDTTRETRVTWTADDVKQAGLSGKPVHQKYPRAMLLARATGELARMVFADVMAGLSYTVEELGMGYEVDGADITAAQGEPPNLPPPPARRNTRSRRPITPAPTTPPPAAIDAASAPVDAPPLPGEPEYAGPDQHVTKNEGPPKTGPQVIAIKLGELGFTDRAERLAVIEDILLLKEGSLESSKDLSTEQITAVIEKLNEEGYVPDKPLRDPPPQPEAAEAAAPVDTTATDVTPPADASPDWSADDWRSFLRERKVKVSELLRAANEIATSQGVTPPATLDAVVTSGLTEVLIGAVEDLAAER